MGNLGGKSFSNICHLSRYEPVPERLVNQPTRALGEALDEMSRLERGSQVRSVGEGGRSKQTFKEI